MSHDPTPSLPHAHLGMDDAQVQRGPAVPAGQTIILPLERNRTTLRRMVLIWWIEGIVDSFALAFIPLIALAVISWIPAVGHHAALRAVPLVALVLYVPWLGWNLQREVSGRPPLDLVGRYIMRFRPHEYKPYPRRIALRLLVTVCCLPAVAVLAWRASVPGVLMGGLLVLPILVYATSVVPRFFLTAYAD